jgi:hypothetical protein
MGLLGLSLVLVAADSTLESQERDLLSRGAWAPCWAVAVAGGRGFNPSEEAK